MLDPQCDESKCFVLPTDYRYFNKLNSHIHFEKKAEYSRASTKMSMQSYPSTKLLSIKHYDMCKEATASFVNPFPEYKFFI